MVGQTVRGSREECGDEVKRLMVIHYPFFGGPHNQALRLNYPLEGIGVSTTVVLPGEPGNAADRLRSAGLDVAEIRLHRIRARVDPRFHVRLIAGFFRDVQRLRARGLIRAKQYTWERTRHAYERLYLDVLSTATEATTRGEECVG